MRSMISEKEIVHVILALSVLIYIVWNRRLLRAIPNRRLFLASYSALVLGLVSTVVEGVAMSGLFNTIEHAMYAAATALFSIWVGGMTLRAGRRETGS